MKKVMVIDDNDEIRQMLKVLLEDNYEIILMDNIVNSINYLINGKVDVVILDILLPIINGIEFLFVLRYLKVPVIIISALDGPQIFEMILKEMNVIDVIKKPFNLQIIKDLIDDVKEDKKGFLT